MNFVPLLRLQGTEILTFSYYSCQGKMSINPSNELFSPLFERRGRTTPGVLLLTYCVTPASKTPGRLFKNTFLLTGTRENVTDPACVRELVCVSALYVWMSVGLFTCWRRLCARWMHVEEAAQIQTCNSHVRETDSTINSKIKSLTSVRSGDIHLLKWIFVS